MFTTGRLAARLSGLRSVRRSLLDARGGLPGRALHAGARGGLRLARARRLHALLRERRARARRRRAAVVRPRARARLPDAAFRRRADGAGLGRLRRRDAAGRAGRARARSCSRCWPSRPATAAGRCAGAPEPGRARAARPRRAHRPGALAWPDPCSPRRPLWQPRLPFFWRPPMFNLAAIHEAIAAAIPERECLVFRDRRLTWAQFTDRTRRLASVLRERGARLQRAAQRAAQLGVRPVARRALSLQRQRVSRGDARRLQGALRPRST